MTRCIAGCPRVETEHGSMTPARELQFSTLGRADDIFDLLALDWAGTSKWLLLDSCPKAPRPERDDASRLAQTASDGEKQFAFVLAALNGKADALKWMIGAGVDVNRPSQDLYSHGTPLHHAVCSGSLEAVKVLVEAGADLSAKDTAWSGTPLGWAEHYAQEAKDGYAKKAYPEIAAYLRERHGNR